jgi:hypothetical protein
MVTRKQGGGIALEYAELNEDQATYLITLFRNSDVVRKFKIQLVKAFRKALNEIDRLRNQTSEPGWTANGTLKKSSKKREKSPPELAEKQRKNSGQLADDKTLQAAFSHGLEPILNPTKTLTIQRDHTNTGMVALALDGEFFNSEELAFYNDRFDVLLNNFEFEKAEAGFVSKIGNVRSANRKVGKVS